MREYTSSSFGGREKMYSWEGRVESTPFLSRDFVFGCCMYYFCSIMLCCALALVLTQFHCSLFSLHITCD